VVQGKKTGVPKGSSKGYQKISQMTVHQLGESWGVVSSGGGLETSSFSGRNNETTVIRRRRVHARSTSDLGTGKKERSFKK